MSLMRLLCLLVSTCLSNAFFMDGLFPNEFKAGQNLTMYASRVDSLQTHIPFNYYQLRFCQPQRWAFKKNTLGDMIMSNQMVNTPYQIKMGEDVECAELCTQEINEDIASMQQWAIDRQYHYSWIIDNLPSALVGRDANSPIKYTSGIPVGEFETRIAEPGTPFREYYLYNHHQLTIEVHETMDDNSSYRIVGFMVEPFSLAQTGEGKKLCNIDAVDNRQRLAKDENVTFTYSVKFSKSETAWKSRWDHYLQMDNGIIHWMYIINSFLIVLCLAALIAHLMRKALKRDITAYELMKQKQAERLKNLKKKQQRRTQQYQSVPSTETGTEMSNSDTQVQEESKEEGAKKEEEFVLDEIAWKKVKGDVFRKPKYAMILSIFVGTGIQILAMVCFLLVFACVGLSSPAYRGALVSAFYIVFILLSNISGYYTARFYKMFAGTEWLLCTLLVSFAYPWFVFTIFLIVNFAHWFEKSQATVPFPTVLVLLFIFCSLSVPNVWLGAFIGFKQPTIKNPGKMNRLSKEIPPQPWYFRMKILIPLGGMIPFAAVFVEMLYVMNSFWGTQLYYMFGFLFLIVLILIVACAEVSIVQTYLQLCAENYQWWWRSFAVSASSGIYLYLFSVYYFAAKLRMTRASSIVVYYSCMMLASVSFSLMTGAIGFIASFKFNRHIYSLIKSD